MPIPITYDIAGNPMLHAQGDMGVFIDIFDPDTRDTDPFKIKRVHIPGLFTGETHKAAPILDPERPRDPEPQEIPAGWRWPIDLGADPR